MTDVLQVSANSKIPEDADGLMGEEHASRVLSDAIVLLKHNGLLGSASSSYVVLVSVLSRTFTPNLARDRARARPEGPAPTIATSVRSTSAGRSIVCPAKIAIMGKLQSIDNR